MSSKSGKPSVRIESMASENKPLLGPELIESNGFRYVRESERERERE